MQNLQSENYCVQITNDNGCYGCILYRSVYNELPDPRAYLNLKGTNDE